MEQIQIIIETLLGQYGWMIIAALATFFFKDAISNVFYGIRFLIGNEYNTDDIVYIKDEKCRIIRQNIFRTTFYSLDDKRKFHIPNNKLQNFVIKKSLPQE